MGGPTRRQRSTSTSTRKRARRQCSWRELEEEETTTTSFHGLSPVLFWLLATSSLIVVITPPSSSSLTPSSPSTPSHRFDPAQFILNPSPSPFSKMYHQNDNHDQRFGQEGIDHMDQYQMAPSGAPGKRDDFYPMYHRPQGLRYRADSQFFPQMMPILTEHRSASPFGRQHHHHHHPAGPSSSSSSAGVDPSIADLDRIDIGWRCDLEGDQMMADQYESDLQTLTEKSTVAPLTDDENKRYEEMSKNYYHGFYDSFAPMNNNHLDPFHHQKTSLKQNAPDRSLPEQQQQPSPSEMLYDKDLLDLLEGTREGGELDMLFEDNKTSPVLNNVSLADAIVHTQANLTEARELQEQCNQLSIAPITPTTSASQGPSAHLESLLNMTDPTTFDQFRQIEQSHELFPQTDYGGFIGMQNDSLHAVISNGQPTFDHQYSNQPPLSPIIIPATAAGRHHQQQQTSTQTSPNSAAVTAAATASLFDSYQQQHHTQRHSFSDCNTDSSSTCSRLSSESPRYNSESSSSTSSGPLLISESRFYGKLVPARGSRFERPTSPRSPAPTKIGRLALTAGQRKRGRQSKDEQLASENELPVTALAISEMTLGELQNVLKKEDLSEYQRQLIRKIRRRGKNKVAARTCRQRRNVRQDKAIEMVHYM